MAKTEIPNSSAASLNAEASSPLQPTGEDKLPKHRIEHSTWKYAQCVRGACTAPIRNGEFRFGTATSKAKTYGQWKHWGCVTDAQIKTFKEIADDVPEQAPGFAEIDDESKEHVRRAFEQGKVVDKQFKGGEIWRTSETPAVDVESYTIQISPTNRAGCFVRKCKDANVKIPKGELRLGETYDFDGERCTTRYKHWACVTPADIQGILAKAGGNIDNVAEQIEGFKKLDDDTQARVLKVLKAGHLDESEKQEAKAMPSTSKSTKGAKQGALKHKPYGDAAEQQPAAKKAKTSKKTKGTKKTTANKKNEIEVAVEENNEDAKTPEPPSTPYKSIFGSPPPDPAINPGQGAAASADADGVGAPDAPAQESSAPDGQ